MRAQMRYANRANANYAIIIGNREIEQNTAAIKPLQSDGDQLSVALEASAITQTICPIL